MLEGRICEKGGQKRERRGEERIQGKKKKMQKKKGEDRGSKKRMRKGDETRWRGGRREGIEET